MMHHPMCRRDGFRFHGRGSHANYQCHYIPVKPMEIGTTFDFRPPPRGVDDAAFDEIVIFQQTDILHQVIVHLKSKRPLSASSSSSIWISQKSWTTLYLKSWWQTTRKLKINATFSFWSNHAEISVMSTVLNIFSWPIKAINTVCSGRGPTRIFFVTFHLSMTERASISVSSAFDTRSVIPTWQIKRRASTSNLPYSSTRHYVN